MHRLAQHVGLVEAIDRQVKVLKVECRAYCYAELTDGARGDYPTLSDDPT
jgi:hypothetical protein